MLLEIENVFGGYVNGDSLDSLLCGQSGIHQRFSYNHPISFGSM
jgi:hypothetical protein